ncbi:MAG: hypothetical protein JWP34_5102 [Massilia sp.]|jgi:tRNA(His) guanylyltransferase|nr:hypothetical protein [Massilia sp.]
MPSDKTALGDRMKGYEQVTRAVLPRRSYTIIRVDGKSFHSYLKHATRPFDFDFMAAMDEVARALCTEIAGSVFAYTQSDEVSVLVTDFKSIQTQPWLGGYVQKLASISASIATAAFNRTAAEYRATRLLKVNGVATFDGRVFTVPEQVEAANYFLWRQRDALRNSILMAAQAQFSARRLHGVNTDQMQEMLWQEKSINWGDYPDGCKRGRVCVRKVSGQVGTFVDERSQQEVTMPFFRTRWETRGAPSFTATPDGFLAGIIPPLPSLESGRSA